MSDGSWLEVFLLVWGETIIGLLLCVADMHPTCIQLSQLLNSNVKKLSIVLMIKPIFFKKDKISNGLVCSMGKNKLSNEQGIT